MNEKKPDYLVLINGENRMPDGFEDSVERIAVTNGVGEQHQIEKKTYEAFLLLQKDLLEHDGIHTELTSVYRSVEQQRKAFDKYLNLRGLEYTLKYVAKPAHSEHHTGLAIDVGIVVNGKLHRSVEDCLAVEELFRHVHKKLAKYGFILRYPNGKENLTKIGYEPWHFRYIDSPEIAKEICDQGICFEEYWEKK